MEKEIKIGSITNLGTVTDIMEHSICVGKNAKGVDMWYKKSAAVLLPNQEDSEELEKLFDIHYKSINYTADSSYKGAVRRDFIAGYKAKEAELKKKK